MATDPTTRALEAVKSVNPGAENLGLLFVHPEFLHGALYVVTFKLGDRERLENYVYMAGDDVQVAKNTSHLVELAARRGRRATPAELFLESGGIAGIIAILITITICGMYITGTKDVPVVLSTALSAILGFYFGTKTSGKAGDSL